MNASRFCIKIFAADGHSAGILDCVPVFHRWIQKQCIENHLLIDVADYSHVWQGPGIVLVSHQANFSTDQEEGRLGLLYQQKQPAEGDLGARVQLALKTSLNAARLLEEDLGGRIKFRGDQVQISLNDRQGAPGGEETLSAIESFVSDLAAKLFPGGNVSFQRAEVGKNRPSVTIRAAEPVEIKTLLERLV
ncbi:MAG: hypothetical protein O2960_02770 [Verrucomicrobia bacterium]|nr:hypothetical protein [Verrucomicrobiota bacterium]